MKRAVYALALLATMIGVAPAHAKTQKQQIAALTKTVKILAKTQKSQARTIRVLRADVNLANARAEDAQGSFMFLANCILVQPAGLADVLDSTTTSSFLQGDATLGIADVFQWLPTTRTVITPDGPSYLALIDESCVAQPTPAPAGRTHGWHPRPLSLSIR